MTYPQNTRKPKRNYFLALNEDGVIDLNLTFNRQDEVSLRTAMRALDAQNAFVKEQMAEEEACLKHLSASDEVAFRCFQLVHHIANDSAKAKEYNKLVRQWKNLQRVIAGTGSDPTPEELDALASLEDKMIDIWGEIYLDANRIVTFATQDLEEQGVNPSYLKQFFASDEANNTLGIKVYV